MANDCGYGFLPTQRREKIRKIMGEYRIMKLSETITDPGSGRETDNLFRLS